jgi:hypothetical protein
MGITVQFESYEEMIGFANKLVGQQPAPAKKITKPVKEEAPAVDVTKVETPENDDYPIPDQQQIEEEAAGEEEVTYTLEEVRAKLTELTRSGKQKEVKAILTSVKAANLTSVDPKDYSVVMEKAGKL